MQTNKFISICGAIITVAIGSGACGGASQEKAEPSMSHDGHAHDHAEHNHADHDHAGHDHAGHDHAGHEHGPLVHRFEDPATWAKEFDDPARDAWQKPADVIATLEINAGMTVADIGAGTGYFERYLAQAVGLTGRVLALDVEDGMVRYIEARMAREGLKNVTATKVPFDDPTLPPNGVDRILIVNTWHHIADREAYAAKLAAGLAPGGLVAVVDFTQESKLGPPAHARIDPSQVKRELEAGGLKASLAVESLPEQYIVIGRKPAP